MCKHINIKYERKGDEVRAVCSCGTIKTNWHDEVWKARICFWQNRTYYLRQNKTPAT